MSSRLYTAPEVIQITGNEPPLTDADTRPIIERVYQPRLAALLLGGIPGKWATSQMRPTSYGGGTGDFWFNCDHRGIWVRYTSHPERAGLITWATAEAFIRDAATPATTAALTEAVRLRLAEDRAWRELIRAEQPAQLDLFGVAHAS